MTALERVEKSKARLMKGNIGIASMLLNLEFVETTSIDTMATNGTQILWNPNFVDSISDDEVEGVLIHECCHVIWEHPLRKGTRHHKLWNYATDYVINSYLILDLNMSLPKGGLFDNKYHKWTAEEVYRELDTNDDALEDAIKNAQAQNDSDSDSEESDDENISTSENISESQDEPADESSSGGQAEDKYDDLPTLAGEVIEPTNDQGEKLNVEELEELSSQIRSQVIMADKIASFGTGGSDLRGRVDELKQTQVDWKSVLLEMLESTLEGRDTWNRPNRRHSWRGIYLPTRDKIVEGGEIVVALDTSMSVSQEELNIFASELQSLCEKCGIDKVRVCYCDDTVRKNDKGEWWDSYDLSSGEDLEFVLRGGGYTRFDPPFNLYNEHTEDTDNVCAFIYFTDLEGYVSESVEPDVPVIWAVSTYRGRSYDSEVPFGEKVYIDVANFR